MPIFRRNNRLGFFIHIPKTAGSSVTQLLKDISSEIALDGEDIEKCEKFKDVLKNSNLLNSLHNRSPCSPQHIHNDIYRCVVDHSKVNFTFAIVRHPEDRIVSEYFWVNQTYSPEAKYASGISKYDHSTWVKSNNFSEWLMYAKKCYDEDAYVWDNHLRKQSDFIVNGTRLFRFDKIEQIPEYLNENLGTSYVGMIVPHQNKKRSKNVIININDEDKKIIKNWYNEDYDLYHSITD